MPSLMFEHLLKDIKWNPQNKIMINGNFSHFYRGFQSYFMADCIEDHEKWTMTSHSMRENENNIPDLKHLPRLLWIDWMKELSTFKFNIHLMDLRAAGTAALNAGYFGIICIGNELMDTYKLIYPEWCVNVYDLKRVRELLLILNERRYNDNFLRDHSVYIKDNYYKYFSVDKWKEKIYNIIK
jgi:hypothetical protein